MTNVKYLTIPEAASICPSGRGGHVDPMTIRNWMKRGIRGVVLKSYKIGGARVTTRADIDQFIETLSRRNSG